MQRQRLASIGDPETLFHLHRETEQRPHVRGNCTSETTRATGITAYLNAGGTIENAPAIAAHESPRTTKLYDRTGDEVTLGEVERFSI